MGSSYTEHERGFINVLLIPLILSVVLLIAAGTFAAWAYSERSDYKDNSDQKVAAAQDKTRQETQAEDAVKYAEEAKNPLKTYNGPSAFGSVVLQYPKTWSAYIEEDPKSNDTVNGYLHPDVVPSVSETDNAFALRVQVLSQSYDQILNQFSGNAKAGKVTITPFELAKVPGIIGSRIDGQIDAKKQGSIIILPLRNMTLKIFTESNDFKPDFDSIILPNLSFSP